MFVVGVVLDGHSEQQNVVIGVVVEDGDNLASLEPILHRIASCAAFDPENGDRSDENPDRSQNRPKSPA